MVLQVEAHHYCTHLNKEVRQCIIFDKDDQHARLIGIEYIISRRLFEQLPEEEKKYWHSHQYEVSPATRFQPCMRASNQIEKGTSHLQVQVRSIKFNGFCLVSYCIILKYWSVLF